MTYGMGPRRRRRAEAASEPAEEDWLAGYRPSGEDDDDAFPAPRARRSPSFAAPTDSPEPASPAPFGSGGFDAFGSASARDDEPPTTSSLPSFPPPASQTPARTGRSIDWPPAPVDLGTPTAPDDPGPAGPPATGGRARATPGDLGRASVSTSGFGRASSPPGDDDLHPTTGRGGLPTAGPGRAVVPPRAAPSDVPELPRAGGYPAGGSAPSGDFAEATGVFRVPPRDPAADPAPPRAASVTPVPRPAEPRGDTPGRRAARPGPMPDEQPIFQRFEPLPAGEAPSPPAEEPILRYMEPRQRTSTRSTYGGRRRSGRSPAADPSTTSSQALPPAQPRPVNPLPDPEITGPRPGDRAGSAAVPGYDTDPGYGDVPGFAASAGPAVTDEPRFPRPPAFDGPRAVPPAFDAGPPAPAAPRFDQPRIDEPEIDEPRFGEPGFGDEPPYAGRSTFDRPVFGGPIFAEPAGPAYVEPGYGRPDRPAVGEPVFDGPGYPEPAYDDAGYADDDRFEDDRFHDDPAAPGPRAGGVPYAGSAPPAYPAAGAYEGAPQPGMVRPRHPEDSGPIRRPGDSGPIRRPDPMEGMRAVRPDATGGIPRITSGAPSGTGRKGRSPLTLVLAVLGVVILLAVTAVSTFLVLRDDDKPGAGPGRTGATAAGKVPPRDISTREIDPADLTEAEVFPSPAVAGAGGQYQVLKTQATKDCSIAATDDLGKLLVSKGCNQVVRGTLKSGDGVYLVTAGVFNLADEQGARESHENIKPTIDAQKGRFTGLLAGANSGTEVFVRAPMILGWHATGHFLAYCIIARADGKTFDPADQVPTQIQADLLTTHLRDTVIGGRTRPGQASASVPPSPSAS